jgi:acyl-CoA thioesterase
MTSSAQSPELAQQTAEVVREGMYANDHAVRALGMTVDAVGPGRATVTLTVRRDMLNGFAICHGGLVATLADTAFAYACNAYNEMTVASGFSIDLLAPSREGDVLTAVAHEVQLAGRTGVYDIDVTNQRGERIAVFRGRSYRMKGRAVVPVAPPPAG